MYFQLIVANAECCFVICYQKEQQAILNFLLGARDSKENAWFLYLVGFPY